MKTTLSQPTVALPSGLSLIEILNYRAQHQPHQLVYQYLCRGEQVETQLSYKDVQRRSQAIAHHLQSLNIGSGRALLLFSPGIDFITAFLGCLYAGITAVPAYPPRKNNKMQRLRAIVADADASAVLTTAALSDKLSRWFNQDSPLSKMAWVSVDQLANHQVNQKTEEITIQETVQKSSLSPNEPTFNNPLAFLQYTSGSTGAPKGVMVSQENLVHNLDAIYRCFGHSSESRGVIWLPPYHDMGLIGGILQPLYSGFPVTLMSPVDFLQKPLRWLQAISTHRATTSGGPDFAYDLCVHKANQLLNTETGTQQLKTLDLSSWQVAFTGAEPIRIETLRRFSKTFSPYGFRSTAFYPCYGMAETTLIVSGGSVHTSPTVLNIKSHQLAKHQVEVSNNGTPERDSSTGLDIPANMGFDTVSQQRNYANLNYEEQSVISCGKSLEDQHVIIVNPKTHLPCGSKEIGEIWVAGRSVAQGYWKNPHKTQETFHAYLAESDEGPFLRTGDLGFLHSGELYVTGRIKDVMIIRGINYYPQDIEETVEKSHRGLKAGAIAAFSVEIKNAERLVIIAEVERTALRKIDVKTAIADIRQAITAQHSLQAYATLVVRPGQIPKTSSGKIQRFRCRELFLGGELAVVEDWSENPKHRTAFVQLQNEVDDILETVNGIKQKV